jgi:hypothetical protein
VTNTPPDDSAAITASIRLPYEIPFDLVVRTFRPLFIFGSYSLFGSRFYALHRTTPIEWACVATLAAFALYLQFIAYRVVIDDRGIYFKNFFVARAREIPWAAIGSVRTGTGKLVFRGATMEGTLRGVKGNGYLMVLDRNDGGPQVPINIKPFSMDGLKILAHFILHRAQHATVDEATKRLTKGFVPSYLTGSREQKGHG